MADDGEYERIPCQDLVLVAQVEGQHLLHSLPIAVQFAQPSVVSSSVQARDLVVRVDVRRGARLWNLAPQDVAVRVVHKSVKKRPSKQCEFCIYLHDKSFNHSGLPEWFSWWGRSVGQVGLVV